MVPRLDDTMTLNYPSYKLMQEIVERSDLQHQMFGPGFDGRV